METIDKAMIIIAVSKYTGDYQDLPGATVSARRLQSWAEQDCDDCRYNVLYLGDDVHPKITADLLEEQVNDFLNNNFIDRLVVYFAGHGIVRSIGSQFWLLTDASSRTTEGIDVEGLRRGLLKCNIGGNSEVLERGQLCMIGDACRNPGRDAMEFHGHPIVTRGGRSSRLQLDRFLSTGLGDFSFQIDASDNQPAFCLFTEILVRAISGTEQQAIQRDNHPLNPVITNHSLGDFLEDEVKQRAADLGDMEPDIVTGIRPPHNYYKVLDEPALPAVDPGLPLAVPAARGMGTDGDGASAPAYPDLDSISESIETAVRQSSGQRVLYNSAGNESQKAMRGTSFCVVCDYRPELVAVPRTSLVDVTTADDGPLYTIRVSASKGSPVLVFNGESWTIAPHYPNVSAVSLKALHDDVLIFKNMLSSWDTFLSDYSVSSFDLPSDRRSLKASEANQYADKIRLGKHRFPHYSVTAGYLYEFSNDLDNILRTTHYMAKNDCRPLCEKVVPFDLALLCADAIRWGVHKGVVRAYADLPAVAKGTADEYQSNRNVRRPKYTGTAFEARSNVPLWGIVPVVREGWTFMQTADYLGIPTEIRQLGEHVGGRSAASFDRVSVENFTEFFNYQIVDVTETESETTEAVPE